MRTYSWGKVLRGFLLSACFIVSSSQTASAANILWGPALGISGDSDVRTDGALVAAINVGGNQTTINGVTFETFLLGAASNTLGDVTLSVTSGTMQPRASGSASNPFAALSMSYQQLLASSNNNTSAAAMVTTVAINGLTAGQTYLVQIWNNDSADFNPPGFTFQSQLDPGARVLDPNVSTLEGGLGEYAVGTFVADASIQEITVTESEVGGRLNGLQLRAIAPIADSTAPTASTSALILLSVGLALGALSRLRNLSPSAR